MKSNAVREPSPEALQAALRRTTETLAAELALPTRVAPDWSDFEWRSAHAVAAIHGVSSLLSSTLRWEGPADWEQFLREQRVHTTNRHRRIEDLLRLVDSSAREEHLAAVALKGVALHAIGVYTPGERPMADLDLLVRERDLARAVRMLEALGFHESFSCSRHRVLVANDAPVPARLGEHSDNGIKIEVHTRVCELLPLHATDISDLLFSVRPQPGLNPYPSPAALMTHLLLHAAGAIAGRSLRLLHLHDIALLSAKLTEEDWNTILEPADRRHDPWWALPPLALTARYYTTAIPARVLAALAPRGPWLLRRISRDRRLSDVSLSFPWIEAFPGIEWSRSGSEMLRYMLRRVMPDSSQRSERKALFSTEPSIAESSWGHLSQSRRLLQWIISRPTRPATMHAVRAALSRSS
jgi:Uncharacterised nucleotidyltransferase